MSVAIRSPHRKEDIGRKWVVDIRIVWDGGETLRKKFIVGEGTRYENEVRTEKHARAWGERKHAEIFAAGPPSKQHAVEEKSKVPTVAEFGPEWIKKQRTDKHKASGIDSQESALRLHIYPYIGHLRLDQVTDRVLVNLKAKWLEGGHEYTDQYGGKRAVKGTSEDKTLNNRLTCLSAMLTYACDATPRVLNAMPCRIKMHKLDKGKTQPFYDHETYERIVAAALKLDPRLYAMILLAGDAGLRRGEIIGLNLTDLDFKRGRITVTRNVFFKKGKPVIDKPKGGHTAGNAATPRLMAALQACRHLRGDRVLYTDQNEPLTPKLLKLWVQRVEKAALLPETGRVHIFRHTFASHLAMSGAPARAIQALCRHASLDVTMGYMHLSPESADQAVDMLIRSRAAGGVAVAGGFVPLVSPETGK